MRIKIGEVMDDDLRHIEFFAVERLGGWKIEKRTTEYPALPVFESFIDAMDAVRERWRTYPWELIGKIRKEDDSSELVYAVKIDGIWSVICESENPGEENPSTFDNMREAIEWMKWKWSDPKWDLEVYA